MATTLQAASTSCLKNAVQSVRPSRSAVSAKSVALRLAVSAKLAGPVRASVQEPASVKAVIAKEAGKLSFVAMNAFLAMPALAEEKGKIFDFDLTLPIMTVQFLLLMYGLDNLWFKPVGQYMDERDELIRKNLLTARDSSDESKQLRDEAESLLRAARAEAAAKVDREIRKLTIQLEAELEATRLASQKELDAALVALEAEKQKVWSALDAQVKALSEEIVQKVVPVKL